MEVKSNFKIPQDYLAPTALNSWCTNREWTGTKAWNITLHNFKCLVTNKGQSISECPHDVLNFPKKNMKKIDKFLPKDLKSGQIIRYRHSIMSLIL